MNGGWCTAVLAGIRLTVRVVPNAKKTEVVGMLGDALKIRLQAQPIEGRANEALLRYIAERLGVPRGSVLVTHGQTNKRKILEIRTQDWTVEAVKKTLQPPS